ncbi:demethylmenaquinone methyltransferase / 2-methoxy-6-polyprenyl-1,4-benzoquinol methylase [Actinopolyspora mzabensis]|uniref:Demethylmenaquinone methyltransferase / 2-methoxy-6-polyprenyl-1,4-benzoquinol methylase n=1 Tax=Actinopolyspora mzabensis TaxID=995066 RepID=A0A1G9CAS5_ACTMZ|nr:class I SAM-dependent methyltransferase [Actinopolyspora mzabensis]SDK48736.1 demethylmenaquinone methyltransferase / 2-methoxy-6-polyprenyl-1,4-benzoquinol methylase [Actinopolyspora mzabensis]
MRDHGTGTLLAEQIDYYRAAAPEYFQGALDFPGLDEFERALAEFAPSGDVLELACGPGTWTPELARHASTLTAVDSSPEMLRVARERTPDQHVRFELGDLFDWRAERRYDVVFFGFWISHVPLDRFADFWALVAGCLAPGGRVLFIDDAHRTPDELIEGEGSSTIRRRLSDGTQHRAVKVPHEPAELQDRLTGLGWDIEVRPTSGPFYWGHGQPVQSAA